MGGGGNEDISPSPSKQILYISNCPQMLSLDNCFN